MKSPGHRRNLLNPNYTKIGIGIVPEKDTFMLHKSLVVSFC
jgi:uncharacterized protein YkwD